MTETKSKQVLDNLPSENIKSQNQVQKSSSNHAPMSLFPRQWLKIGSFVLIAGIIGGGVWYWSQNRVKQQSVASNQPPATAVKLSTLTTSTIEESGDFLGSLEAKQTVELLSELEGRIVEILVKEGQNINQGDTLFSLESQTLQAQLNQAQANLQSRQARLMQLQTGSRKEDIAAAKARVQQAQIRLANSRQGSSQAEIAQSQAQLISAQAEAQLAQQKVERYNLLKEEGAISQDQFDNFLTEAKTAQAQVDVAERRLEELQQGTTSDIAQLEAALVEAQQNLQRLQNGARKEEIAQATADVQEAKANVERIETLLDKSFIKAPIRGKIGDIAVKIGDYVDDEDTLTTITENSRLELSIAIPLEKAPNLRIGLPIQVLDEQKKVIATAKINFIESNVNSDSQLVIAKAFLDNLDRKLLNRQFIQSRIIWNTTEGILVPTSAIFRIGGQAFVFIAKANPSGEGLVAQQKAITLGEIQGNQYQVLEGLVEGDKIITAGILQVRDGEPIQEIAESDTNSTSSNN